jgi:hypothetical protein
VTKRDRSARSTLPAGRTFKVLICILAAALSAVSLTASIAESAISFFQPSILTSEEYNDNIFLTTNDRLDDYITKIDPSFLFIYRAPLWDWDVKYTYDYLYYAKSAFSKTNRHTSNLVNQDRVIDGLLFFHGQG